LQVWTKIRDDGVGMSEEEKRKACGVLVWSNCQQKGSAEVRNNKKRIAFSLSYRYEGEEKDCE